MRYFFTFAYVSAMSASLQTFGPLHEISFKKFYLFYLLLNP